jgi:hypothetical protein
MRRSHLLLLLAGVIGLNVAFWLATQRPNLAAREAPPAPPTPQPAARDWAAEARQVFDHGNALLRQARQKADGPDTALLKQAAAHYRGCLTYEERVPGSGTLFEDTRHNLELARLLLLQAEQNKPARPDPSPKPGDALARADKPSAKDDHDHDHPDDKHDAAKHKEDHPDHQCPT